MKDIGEADVILGIRFKHESNGISISPSHYIEKVLKKFNYFDCTLVSTPMDTSEKLMPNNGQVVSQLEYSRVIGCLMYAMTCTRPDIAFTVGEIFWAYKKQTCITSSTIEYEFMALAAVGKEAEWLKNLLLKIPLWSKPIAPISICCDSAATLAKAYSQMYNGKSRHLGVRHNMIRELITNEVVSLEFVRSQQNLVDHLTKELDRDLVIKMCLEPAEKEDEVVNFLMFNFFEKVLSRSMNKEESPIFSQTTSGCRPTTSRRPTTAGLAATQPPPDAVARPPSLNFFEVLQILPEVSVAGISWFYFAGLAGIIMAVGGFAGKSVAATLLAGFG
ncbi:hypothetical protein Tco_0439706 [Tanacetum coccineum]